MPMVDGYASTKMIRSFEKTHVRQSLSHRAEANGRIPIFAVSASLVEVERDKYIETGFDGWILKPVDFKRVNLFLKGIVDASARDQCLYEPGKWERGGWFHSGRNQSDTSAVDTARSGKAAAVSRRSPAPPARAVSSTPGPPPATMQKADTV